MSQVFLHRHKVPRVNQRHWALICFTVSFVLIVSIIISGALMGDMAVITHVEAKNLFPNAQHLFGTDWLGRDMLSRTLKGLSTSILIGMLACTIGGVIAGVLGVFASAFGRKTDWFVELLINIVMGIPHILLLILISYALGKGLLGVTVAVAISHWPPLARIVRGEVLVLKVSPYIKISQKLGQSKLKIAYIHMFPHMLPQFLTGLILLFPHAILHEATLTFLGFGLRPEQPGIGQILSESMKYLALGMWWLALFPGIALLFTVLLFDLLGSSLKNIFSNYSVLEGDYSE